MIPYWVLFNSSSSENREWSIECEGWRQHSILIFLILLFTKPNIEVSGWLYQTKTHFTHIVYQPFSRVSPPSFTLYALNSYSVIFKLFDWVIRNLWQANWTYPMGKLKLLERKSVSFSHTTFNMLKDKFAPVLE